ncbi:MAG: RluA family pseudouridine synthase [Balneolaceae bacterium]
MLVKRDNPNRTEYMLTVPEGQQTDVRLDRYITSFVENVSRTKVKQAIKDGYVIVNGRPEKPSYIMQPRDVIDISLPKPPPPKAGPEKMELDIIYEDEDLLIVNKEPDMVVHPAFGNWSGTLVNGLLYHTSQNLSTVEDETLRPGIVHRLDKDTSGLLVVAKNDTVHRKLGKQFARRDVDRTYWSIVWGRPPKSGVIRGNIGRSPQDRKIMTVLPEGRGKTAGTQFTVLEYFDYLALVELSLETGRTHQIRVHMQHEGYYVFGDTTYGGDSVRYGQNTGSRKAMFQRLFKALPRQALHAKTLGFHHPGSETYMTFDSPLPNDFSLVLDTLRNNCKPQTETDA